MSLRVVSVPEEKRKMTTGLDIIAGEIERGSGTESDVVMEE